MAEFTFKAGDLTGRAVGRIVGYEDWIKAESLWSGRTCRSEHRHHDHMEWDENRR